MWYLRLAHSAFWPGLRGRNIGAGGDGGREVCRAAEITGGGNYGTTRFNALRHGVLSRHTVLVWGNEAEYQALLAALVAEHEPNGVTEEHLVEELAGIIWRKRRVRMAEAAVYREKLRRSASDYIGPNHVAGAALLPLTGDSESNASIPRAIAASAADTARDLGDAKRDQGMTQRALNILEAGGPNAYEYALGALPTTTVRTCRRLQSQSGCSGRHIHGLPNRSRQAKSNWMWYLRLAHSAFWPGLRGRNIGAGGDGGRIKLWRLR